MAEPRADSTIGGLPNLAAVADDALLAAEFQGEAYHLTGAQWKEYARESVRHYVSDAQQAAQNAQQSASSAAQSAAAAQEAREATGKAAEAAAESAEQARQAETAALSAASRAEAAADNAAQETAELLRGEMAEYVSAAESAADLAGQAATAAGAAAQTAGQSEEAARQSAADAAADRQGAEQASAEAQSAQAAAETARTAAAASETAAGQAKAAAEAAQAGAEKARTEAAQSAETAIQYSGKPPMPMNGTWWVWNAEAGEYEDTGIHAILSIVKSYGSVEEMEADLLNMQEGDLVIIAADINVEDNARLYVHTGTQWQYLSDLSGIQGVGISSIVLTEGDHRPGTTDWYTISLTDGREFLLPVYNGADGTGVGDMLARVYDPQGKRTDIFQYVDDKIKSVGITATDDGEGNVTVTVVGSNIAYNDGNLIIG